MSSSARRWRLGSESSKVSLGWRFYAIQAFQVLVHSCCLYGPPITLTMYAMAWQHTWGLYVAPTGVGEKTPLIFLLHIADSTLD